ncbi:hypothetical protein [Pimelobacter simplex]|uniref:hypothetical protein n=1 Tax=Nocardioides simplex TaxID=2045 RepID=UPI003AAB1436
MLPDDPLARARRRSVVLTAFVVVLVLGAIALKVTSQQVAQALGDRAWRAGDPAAAERSFEISGRLNLVQRWIAPYNRGVAAYGQRRWGDAAGWFEQALDLAPESARCRVALNWSWTLEEAGDELAAAGDRTGAAGRWNEALVVLDRAVGCAEGAASGQPDAPTPDAGDQDPTDAPTDDPGTDGSAEGDDGAPPAGSEKEQRNRTADRLSGKMSGNPGGKPGAGDQEDPSAQDQTEQLDDRNRDAAKARREAEDQSERDRTDGPERTW